MTPEEFKSEWNIINTNDWWKLDEEKLIKFPALVETKKWLLFGLPKRAAPFLGFGLLSFGGKFCSIQEHFPNHNLDPSLKNYWFIGGDGGGNSICIDITDQDSIQLLNHEENFQSMGTMNLKISELAQCLLEYKRFVQKVQSELGRDALSNSKFTKKHVVELRDRIEKIRSGLLKSSNFWGIEIENLFLQAK